jgi:hypothetical protein
MMGIILRFLRHEVPPLVLPFYNAIHEENKLKFFSLISKTIGLIGFLSSFPPVNAFLIVVSITKRCFFTSCESK